MPRLPELLAFDEAILERADGVVFRRIPSNGRLGDLLVRAAPDRVVQTIEPFPFRLRGPAIHAVLNLRQRVEPVDSLSARSCGVGCLEAALPESLGAGEEVSLFVLLPYPLLADGEAPEVLIGAGESAIRLPFHWTGPQQFGHLFVTSRIELPPAARTVRLVRDAAFGPTDLAASDLAIQLHRWRPHASAAAPAANRETPEAPTGPT